MNKTIRVKASKQFYENPNLDATNKVRLIKMRFQDELMFLNKERYSVNPSLYPLCEREIDRLVYFPIGYDEELELYWFESYCTDNGSYFIWDTDRIFKELKITLAKD